MEEAILQTPLGRACIKGEQAGIRSLTLSDEPVLSDEVPDLLKPACTQLQEYFSGSRKAFSMKLAPEGTPFQMRVWQTLLDIPFGKTITYLDLARRLGDVRAVRAVAAANAQNPLWIFIPCHRVIGTDGSMRGYAGGIGRKKWLLEHESASKQISLFQEKPTPWSV